MSRKKGIPKSNGMSDADSSRHDPAAAMIGICHEKKMQPAVAMEQMYRYIT